MTTTPTKYPATITQTTGGHNSIFKDLNNLKTASGYARSDKRIEGKIDNKYKPSKLTLTNYKLGIPSDARVRKITVEYAHYRRGSCGTNPDYYPCDNPNPSRISGLTDPNIPAPTIQLTGHNNLTKLKKKGSAPTKTLTNKSVSFSCDLPASNFADFGVIIDYPANTGEAACFLYVKYVRVKIEYVRPSYTATISKVTGGYNHEEYRVKATISNKNKVPGNPEVNIEAPVGFSFKEAKGASDSTTHVEQLSARTVKWTPNVSNIGSDSVELVWDTNVSYPSGSSSYSGTFTIGVPLTSATGSYTATITERPPGEDSDSDDGSKHYEDDGKTYQDIRKVTVNDEFTYTFSLDDAAIDAIVTEIYEYGVEQSWWSDPIEDVRSNIISFTIIAFNGGSSNTSHLSENECIYQNTGSSWSSAFIQEVLSVFISDGQEEEYTLKAVDTGEDKVHLAISYWDIFNNHRYESVNEARWTFQIRPLESSLSEANFVKLGLSEEELDRLGDGYTYQAQSDLKLITSETYVRDWYRNFRIGVYNNPIEANITNYINYDTDGTVQNRDILVPSRFDLTGASLTYSVDKALTLDNGETSMQLTPSNPVTVSTIPDYTLPFEFQKVNDNEVVLTVTLKDSNSTVLDVTHYKVRFNQEAELPPYETTTDTTDYDNLTDAQIFHNAQYWSEDTAGLNSYNSILCEFTYNENYPFYVLITGDYSESEAQGDNNIKFTEPCIIEDDEYTERQSNGNYPIPLNNIVLNDGSTAETVLPAYNRTENIILYDFPLDEDYGTNTDMAIRGIEINGTIDYADELSISANLKSPTGESKTRSIIIDETDTEFTIGGLGDLWGFSTLDLVNLEEWEAQILINNTLQDQDTTLLFGNLQITFYIEQIEKQNITCKIEDEDIGYYGVFLTNVTIPEGLETNTAYLKVDGTDTNDAYRQNIKEKEITIEGEIGDNCDLKQATYALREFTKLLVNDRDEYNRPIPKTIEFSHYPDVYWEYVMEEALDSKVEISSYKFKAKLTIPAGTAYDKETTSTSNSGYVNGIATVNPIITVKPTDTVISITETVTNQKFSMGYPVDEWIDKIIEIDTEDRKVYLKDDEDDTDETDITAYTDYNCDWFRLKGEYSFEGTNCIIRTVSFEERW